MRIRSPWSRRRKNRQPLAQLIPFGQYLAVAAVFGVLALVLPTGGAGSAPTTFTEWLTVAGLVPAGVGGVLIGDRVGLWLKDLGIGRQ